MRREMPLPAGRSQCLKRRTRPAEEVLFLGRTFPAQHGIAVRITAEAVDNGFVAQFDIRRRFGGVAFEQRGGLGVDGAAFAVHQRHQYEMPLFLFHGGESGQTDGFLREADGGQILREGGRAVAEQVARKLVEYDDFGQPAAQGVAPVGQLSCRRLLPQREKTAADVLVEIVVFGKPKRAVWFGKPKIQYVLGIHWFSFLIGGRGGRASEAV